MLLEEGFSVTSTDASDKMLKYALKERWERRKEDALDKWGMYDRCNVYPIYIVLLETFYPHSLYGQKLLTFLTHMPVRIREDTGFWQPRSSAEVEFRFPIPPYTVPFL